MSVPETAIRSKLESGQFATAIRVRVAEIERLACLSFGSPSDFDSTCARETTGITPRGIVHESTVIL